jgi:hypothetical protein
MGDEVIGFYYCNIDQSNLKLNNLPKIYAQKKDIENNWDHDVILENYLISNVMIGLLKKYECKVEIKKGFYFSEKKKSCEMFDFILDCMGAKNEQDNYNKNKDSKYNPALRETLKLLMNSLSGKVIEGLHTEKTTDVNNLAEMKRIEEKATKINYINTVGNKIFVTYEIDSIEICEKQQRPIFLGVLIYDYAKRYMFENSYSKIGLNKLYYTDTDASKFKYADFVNWKKWIDTNNVQVPHWKEVEKIDNRYKNHRIYEENSKVFGSFEDELKEMTGENYDFYCLQKKSWAYFVDDKSKFKFKGVNEKSILVDLNNIADIIIKKDSKYKLNKDKKKVYKYISNNKDLQLKEKNNAKILFEKLYKENKAYVLTSSFRKIVKNSLHNVKIDETDRHNKLMNKIQVNYSLKNLVI